MAILSKQEYYPSEECPNGNIVKLNSFLFPKLLPCKNLLDRSLSNIELDLPKDLNL